jgi:hypothetical protein
MEFVSADNTFELRHDYSNFDAWKWKQLVKATN